MQRRPELYDRAVTDTPTPLLPPLVPPGTSAAPTEPTVPAPLPPSAPTERPLNAFQVAWKNPWLRLAVFLLGFFLLWRFAGLVQSVLVDFAIAYLIAYLVNPMLNWLQKGRVKRGLGVLVVLLVIAGLFGMLGVLMYTVSSQFIDLLGRIPTQAEQINQLVGRVFEWLAHIGVPNTEEMQGRVVQNIQIYIDNIGKNILPMLQNMLSPNGPILKNLLSIGGILGQIVLIILMSVYVMLDYSRLNTSLLRAFPRPWQPRVLELSELVATAVGGYVRGQLMIASFIGLFVWIWLMVIGIPSAAAIGFLAGIFNIVPYLGPIIGATPAILLALTLPSAPLKILLVVVGFLVANQIEGNFLSPYILGKTTDLHPLTVLLAILIGASLLGFVGALLAVPVAALLKLLIDKYYFPSRVYSEGP